MLLNRRYFGEKLFDRLVIAGITGLWLITDNQIKNNVKTQIVCENETNYLKLESKFTASNCGSLDLGNYCIEIVNSNINIYNSSLISNLGIFDYSNNKNWKEIHGGLEYKFKILDEIKSEIKLDIVLKVFTKSNYKILSRKDIGNFFFTNKPIKLINLSNNHIALDIIDISNPLIYPYKDGKISNSKGIHAFPLYKPLYEYLISEKDITIEKLSTRFPLEIFKKLNTKGTYKIILPETSIGNEIIIFQKKYKKMELNVE